MSVFRRNNYIFLQGGSLATSSESALNDIISFSLPFCLLSSKTSKQFSSVFKVPGELDGLPFSECDYVFTILFL